MTGGEIMAVVGFFLTIAAAASAVWWRIEGKVKVAEDKADNVRMELAAHRLHTAETFVTKVGMQEQTAQIMRSIEAVGDKIDRTNERLDRVFEQSRRVD